jgi:diguanylate cyclase (GGDEF)-like protein
MDISKLLPQSRHPHVKYIISLYAGWAMLFVIFFSFVVNREMNEIEAKFQNIHNTIHRHIADTVKIFEVSIESFASVLALEQSGDFKRARQFAQQLRSHYPDIFMFEVAQRVLQSERDELEKSMRQAGYSDFIIHTFGYDTDRKTHLSPVKDVYYPIVFIEPEQKESLTVLGLDLSDTSSILKDTLERSFDKRTHVASRPFTLIENNQGYILYREVRALNERSQPELEPRQELYALLVVDVSRLLPGWARDIKGLSFSLHYPGVGLNKDGNLINYSDNTIDTSSWHHSLLPKFEKTSALKSKSQPFTLSTEYSVRWSDLNFGTLFIYFVFAAVAFPLAFWISMVLYRNKVEFSRQQERNYRLANYDVLTELPNKIYSKSLFNETAIQVRKNKKKLVFLYIDLDKFKQVNDQYGHQVGDLLLQYASKRLRSVLRDSDILSRLHGDEFLIILNEIDDVANIQAVIENIKTVFKTPFNFNGITISIELSIGTAVFPDDGLSFESLLDTSDKNMYKFKKGDNHAFIHIVSND